MAFEGSIYASEVVRTPKGFPTKLYTFTSALHSFDSYVPEEYSLTNRECQIAVKQKLLNILAKYPKISSAPHLYAIAAAWGQIIDDKRNSNFDIASYRFDRPWKICNPDRDSWVFSNGVEIESPEVTCETTDIFIGEEGKLRRKSENLEQFLSYWPDLGDLGPIAK